MGVDCRILLPENVRLCNVVSVIGASVGCPKAKQNFSSGHVWYANIDNIKVEAADHISPDMARITISQKTIDGHEGHFVLYFFEADGGRLMLPPSTGFWIYVGRRLVSFFGGKLDYNDCDGPEWDVIVPAKSDNENRPSGGEPWYNLQERILAIQPISKEEWEMNINFAAYGR